MPGVRAINADCREAIKDIPDNSVDSCVTDPPYSLVSITKRFGKPGSAEAKEGASGVYRRASAGFMGQQWDTGEVAFDPAFWVEVLRVLKPGAHLLAFGGTRSYHRLAVAIEDAGFEIRDAVLWHYGTGFPKSHNVSVAIDKAARGFPHGGHLTDSPNAGLFKTQATEGKRSATDPGQQFGAGPGQFMAKGKPVRRLRPGADQHKDGSWEKLEARTYQPRVYIPGSPESAQWEGWGTALKPATEIICLARKPLSESNIAANVLKWGTGALNIDGCRIALSGDYKCGANGRPSQTGLGDNYDPDKANQHSEIGRWPANLIHDGSEEVLAGFPDSAGQLGAVHPDTGKGEKTNTIYGKFAANTEFAPRGDCGSAARYFYSAKADKADRWGSKHPTVKPVDLIRYLCRLITPPKGTVIDPFAGSGTLGVAALAEGFDAILIEREAAYFADIEARIAFYQGQGNHSLASKGRNIAEAEASGSTLPLFADPETEEEPLLPFGTP